MGLKKIIGNIYFKNIALMIIIFAVLIFIALFGLDKYTRHNEKIEVPYLKGLQVEEAAAILRSSGLEYEVVDSIFEKKGVPGSVLEQIPKEKSYVKGGRSIYLTVQAKAEQLVPIPDLEDYSQRQAQALLNSLGFNNIQISEVKSEYKGLVIAVEYKGIPIKGGQKVPKGSVLVMKVGSGGEESSDTDTEIVPETTNQNNEIDPLFQ